MPNASNILAVSLLPMPIEPVRPRMIMAAPRYSGADPASLGAGFQTIIQSPSAPDGAACPGLQPCDGRVLPLLPEAASPAAHRQDRQRLQAVAEVSDQGSKAAGRSCQDWWH